jgi:hypothetical protein
MTFKQYLEAFQAEGKPGIYGQVYKVTLADDTFLHFTLGSRATQIIAAKKLLMNPPFQKFGTDSVDAISGTYGRLVPSVQLTHIKPPPNDIVVCVVFQTNVKPYAAYPEEVKWNCDVPLLNAKVTSVTGATRMLQQPNDFRKTLKDNDEYQLRYV